MSKRRCVALAVGIVDFRVALASLVPDVQVTGEWLNGVWTKERVLEIVESKTGQG